MTPLVVGYIGLAILILLLFSGLHIGIVMGVIGFLGMAYLNGWDAGLGVMKTVPFSSFASYDFSVIPLFLLMGEFCFHANISDDLYIAAHKIMGKVRGGLAIATIGACAAFSAVSGSSVATAATMSKVALPEMKRYGYDMALATGTLAAGGTLGILIPPSVVLVTYGILTSQSIGKLFLAGFVPGIMQAILFMIVIYYVCWRNPSMGPSGPGSSLIEKIKALKGTWIVVLLFLIVIGGIYFGIFNANEGAGIGAMGALIFAVARKRLGWKQYKESVVEACKTTAMILFIVVGAMILGYFLTVTKLPAEFSLLITGAQVNRYIVWCFVIILYLFLGTIMDTLAMILLTVPIIYPTLCGPNGLGFDPIWYGIMLVILVEIALITPPVGMNVFVIKGMAPEVPTSTIFKGIVPFLIADGFQVAILTIFPIIVLWLPHNLK
jgi:C4-dicarboxylate transporter, DctM subunit